MIPKPPSENLHAPAPRTPERLESWKEIAAYLKRSVSTVQRWEQEEGLPVHRLVHAKGGSVYALTEELDAWYDARDPLLDAEGTTRSNAEPGAPSPLGAPAGQGSVTPASDGSTGSTGPFALAPRAAGAPAAGSSSEPVIRLVPQSAPSRRVEEPAVAEDPPRNRLATVMRVALPTATVIAACAALVAWMVWPVSVTPVVRAELDIAPAEEVNAGGFLRNVYTPGGARTAITWTPDGRLLFVGRRQGRQQIYIRDLAGAEPAPLEGTDGGQVPVVSPDGQWVVFWAVGEIRRVPLGGGPAQTLVPRVPIPPAGIAVGATGRIVFSAGTPAGEPLTESIWEARGGGAPVRLTSHLPGEMAHMTPQLADDDRVLLFTAKRTGIWGREQVVAQDLSTGARDVVIEDAADARYLAPGRLCSCGAGC